MLVGWYFYDNMVYLVNITSSNRDMIKVNDLLVREDSLILFVVINMLSTIFPYSSNFN